ncbi:hypothetical protein, partial [Streptomyces sp. WAC07061]|uniref:hypothetical protein n=1 Tax=Streptomyces sp. WAC07061 TaxID=2487410 RepID=UPI0021AFEE3E
TRRRGRSAVNPAAPAAPHSLYPELDATALTAFATALESGDPAGLPPARAAEYGPPGPRPPSAGAR